MIKQLVKKVTVEKRINGAMYITYNGVRFKYKKITARPLKEKPKSVLKLRKLYRPSPEYPWRNASNNRLMLEKAHLQKKKVNEELILTKV